MSGFRQGIGAVEKAIAKSNSGGGGGKFKYVNWADGDRKAVRFVADLVAEGVKTPVKEQSVTALIHTYIPTNTGRKWTFVCRKDPGIGDKTCPVCDRGFKPSEKTISLAVVLEEVYEEKKVEDRIKPVLVGYKDFLVERDEKIKELVPLVGIVMQAGQNFWSKLVGFSEKYETICDRVYEIKRRGKGMNDTDYSIIPDSDYMFDPKTANAYVEQAGIHIIEYLESIADLDKMKKLLSNVEEEGIKQDIDDTEFERMRANTIRY